MLSLSVDGYRRLLRIEQDTKTLMPNSATSTHIAIDKQLEGPQDIEEWKKAQIGPVSTSISCIVQKNYVIKNKKLQ